MSKANSERQLPRLQRRLLAMLLIVAMVGAACGAVDDFSSEVIGGPTGALPFAEEDSEPSGDATSDDSGQTEAGTRDGVAGDNNNATTADTPTEIAGPPRSGGSLVPNPNSDQDAADNPADPTSPSTPSAPTVTTAPSTGGTSASTSTSTTPGSTAAPSTTAAPATTVAPPTTLAPEGVDLSNAVLASSYGFDANNATEAFRQALLSADPVVIIDDQGSDWMIDPIKVFDVTDKIIVFEPGVTVRARPGAFSASNAIMLNLVRPVGLEMYGNGATLDMNKSEYTTGEGRHAVALVAADGVTISDFTISDSGGDGLYIAGHAPPLRTYSSNIYVDNVVFDNHRRQGMSIISAENVFVSNSTFSNTIGTLPEAGVDLEPNQPYHRLVNINFDRSRFVNNGHAGFVVASLNLDENSIPISVNVTNSYFSMNHRAGNAFSEAELVFGANRTSPVTGSVVFDNVEFDGSEWSLLKTRRPSDGYSVTMRNIVARDLMQTSGAGLINFEVPSYDEPGTLGNFHFENVTATYTADVPVLYVFNGQTLTAMNNVTGSIDVRNPGDPAAIEYRVGEPPQENNVTLTVRHIQ